MTQLMRWLLTVAPLTLVLGACAMSPPPNGANANTPGWTGSTVVVGNTSTIAGDAQATYLAQKWGSPSRR